MDKRKVFEWVMIGGLLGVLILFVFCNASCVTTGEFDGKIKNPDGSLVYTFEGGSESHSTVDVEALKPFTLFGLSLEEILFILVGTGVVGTSGYVAKKKLDKGKKKDE